jgi:hypothetical protein
LIAAAILALVASEAPRLLDVRVESVGSRRALRFTVVGGAASVAVAREGEDLVLTLGAAARAGLVPPEPVAPVQAIRLDADGMATRIRIRVPASVPHDVQRLEGQILLVLGGDGAREGTAELYRGLFPGTVPEDSGSAEGPAAASGPPTDDSTGGLDFGALTLRPALVVSAVVADATPVVGVPIEERQLHIEPRVGFDALLGAGRVTGSYMARLRRGTRVPELSAITESTTHFADATLELPLGSSLELRVGDHFSTGVLETDQVDPGFEYFTNLARYKRNQLDGELRYSGGGRLGLETGASLNDVHLDDTVPVEPSIPAGFFDYQTWSFRFGVFYELAPELEAELDWSRYDTPTPEERPLAESTLDSFALHLTGDLSPLTQVELGVGYDRRRSPRAMGEGRAFDGLGAALALRRELGEESVVELGAGRGTRLSNFEDNAFYVASSVFAQWTRMAPLSLSVSAGAGYHWNDYRVASASLGEPRADRIFGWNVGLGRSLSRWAYVRADYSRQQRSSNLAVFENTTDALVVQLGLAYGEARR